MAVSEGITEIEDRAFQNRNTVTRITIKVHHAYRLICFLPVHESDPHCDSGERCPNWWQSLAGCTALIDITIPKSVECIGSGAFSDTNLAKETIQAVYDQAEKTETARAAEALLEHIFSDNEGEDYL